MPKKIPMRKCIVTQERFPKKELLRIVRTPEGTLEVDLTGKRNGHGAYMKKDLSVFETAKKKRVLQSALETEIPEEFWEEIRKAIGG